MNTDLAVIAPAAQAARPVSAPTSWAALSTLGTTPPPTRATTPCATNPATTTGTTS